MKKIILISIVAFTSMGANASEWVHLSSVSLESGLNISFSIDAESISETGRYRTAFRRVDYSETQFDEEGSYNLVITLNMWDCNNKPKRNKILSFLSRLGNNTVSFFNYKSEDWQIIYPDTTGETLATFVCSY